MDSLLEKLENNEAVLLMYLAGELPAEDRIEVEQMLANDPALAAEMAELRTAQSQVEGSIAAADGPANLHQAELAAAKRVSRMMSQWNVNRIANTPQSQLTRRGRYPWWVYPTAGAACLFFGFMAWWGNTPSNPARMDGPGIDTESPYAEVDAVEPVGPVASLTQDTSDLKDVERELKDVAFLRNDAW